MSTTLPDPVLRPAVPASPDLAKLTKLETALRAAVDGEVRLDAGTLGAYSTDSSNYRQVPLAVVVPHTVDAAVAAVRVCREQRVPVTSRGGGTSLAGECTNAAVMIDWAKYCNKLISVDPDRKTCLVEPGIVLDVLNSQLGQYGLRYGPEPSTHPNCTLGGMIGNNSCGATAQRTGKVVDNLVRLEVVTYDGARFWCGPTDDDEYARIERRGDRQAAIYRQLRRLRDTYADEIRARYPDIPRRVSGYNLDSLLPEHNFDVAGLLVGSEGSLVTVLRAELKLVPVLKEQNLVVIGYDNIADAGDAVPAVLPHDPIALEGLDHRLVEDQEREDSNLSTLALLPEGKGFLLIQFGGDTREEVDRAADGLLADLDLSRDDPRAVVMDDQSQQQALWSVREAGLGATAHVPGQPSTWPGWEDSAIAPDQVGNYLRDLESLYEKFGYAGETAPSIYGHFGQGCIHTRIPFRLTDAEGVAHFRAFIEQAADLVTSYGGSLSGEHGDGQARGELLPKMFGDQIMTAFGQLKAIFDPDDLMNPGKVAPAYRLDDQLRLGSHWAPHHEHPTYFTYPKDGGSFISAANRCAGVGRCRQHTHEGGKVMCPSYQVTMEEEHSTRGRARLLFEMLDGHSDSPIKDGWRSKAVKDALDLCLACKGCLSDCPVNVDMATYKAEFLAQHYRDRLRPRSHYALGWLPTLTAVINRLHLAPVVNALSQAPLLPHLATRIAGLADREIPLFAPQTLQQWWTARPERPSGRRGSVLLWPDTFTNTFTPEIGIAAVHVLEEAGWTVKLPTEQLCCGLTWISTGQLDHAKKVLRTTVAALADHLRDGGLVVGLEPSCTAVFRHDMMQLLGDNLDANRLNQQTVTLAELLKEHTPDWAPPKLDGVKAISQVHCHQHAVMKWNTDEQLLSDCGVDEQHLDSGCCGLAGNFGFEKGHEKVSRDCAEQGLLPAVRDASTDTVVLADGFSCRTQIHEFGHGVREGAHLAELLDSPHGVSPTAPKRTPVPPASQRYAALGAVTGIAAGGALGATAVVRRLTRH